MQLNLAEVYSDKTSVIKVNGDKLQYNGTLFDFTNLPNGVMTTKTDDVVSAKRVDGVLTVTCIKRINKSSIEHVIEHGSKLDSNLTIAQIDWYSDDERALDESLSVLQPTPQEIEAAEFEVKLIDKLLEWGIL